MSPGRRRAVMFSVGGVCLAVMAVLGVVIRERLSPLDRWVLRDAQVAPDSALGRLVEAVSGAAVLLCAAVLVAVIVLAWRRYPGWRGPVPRAPLVLAACCAVALLDVVFRRPGPPVVAQDWTYPSGHASIVVAVAFTAVLLTAVAAPRWLAVVIAVEGVAVVATMVGRIVAGEHYVTDVVGAMIGVVGVGLVVAAALGLRPAAGRLAPGSSQPAR